MDLDWGFPSQALYKSMIVSFLRLVLGLYKRGYLLIFIVCHFDYTAFAAGEKTGSRKPVKSHRFIGCHYKCTQTDRPKSARNRCVYSDKKYASKDLSLTGLNAKCSGDNLCREHRHKLSPGDNSCCRQFMPATIHAANISMNRRRRRFMPWASAWIVAGDNSCRNKF